MLSFISLTIFYILHIFQKATKIKHPRQMAYSCGALILGISFLFGNISDMKFFARDVFKYYNLGLIFVISLIILIFANFKFKRKQNSDRRLE